MDEQLYGLLGIDPEKLRQQAMTQGLLSAGLNMLAASGPSRMPVGLGQVVAQGGAAGLQAYQGAQQQGIQDALQRMQLKQMLDQQTKQKNLQTAIQGAVRPVPTEQSMRAAQSNIDPAMLEAMSVADVGKQAMAQGLPTQVGFDRDAYMSALAKYAPEQYAQLMMKPDEEYTLGPDQVRMRGGKVIATGLPKPREGTTDYQNYQTAKAEGYKGSFMQYQQDLRKAGASTFNTNDPTRVFQELRAIGKDFNTELEKRGFTETADRYRALDTSVRSFVNDGNRAAIGAIIYNTAKIYDPSGAVQEGDKQTVLGNRSLPDSFKALARKALEGGDMLPSEAIDLYTNITKIVQEKANLVEPIKRNYAADMDALRPGSSTRLINPFESIKFGEAIGTTVRERK